MYSAIHFITVRCKTPLASLTSFPPLIIRNESLKWQIIWCADIRPQRRVLDGVMSLSLRTISARHSALASVFIRAASSQEPLPAGLAECGECFEPPRFGLGEK